MTMKSAVIYARLSDVRKGDTEGIDRQIREGEAHAKRLGVKVVERLIDNDISAADRKKNRPDFQRLMAGMAANTWDVAILRSLERWVRVPRELEDIIEVAEKSKVRVESIHGGQIDLSTRQGRMLARMMTTIAIDEVDAVRERVTDWHRDRADRGLPGPGYAGYGFEDDKVTIDKAEAKRIKEAAKRVLAGESLQSIATRWNDAGVPFREGEWEGRAIRRVLLAPRVTGLRSHNEKLIPATWPAIIDRETFDRVGRILTSPSRRKAVNRDQKLLTGILTCGVGHTSDDKRPLCGKPLNSKTDKKGQKYYCRFCLGTLVAAQHVEDFIVGAVAEAVDGVGLAARVRKMQQDAGTVDKLGVIRELEAQLVDLAREAGEGAFTVAEWRAMRTGIDARLAALRAETRQQDGVTPLARWAGKGTDLLAEWTRLGHQDKREIITAVFDDVIILPARPGFNRFDEGRIRLVPSALAAKAKRAA